MKPDHAASHYNLGVISQGQGCLEEAAARYAQAIAVKPDFADAYANLGAVLRRQGRVDEAIERYERALAIKPAYPSAMNDLGALLGLRGDVAGSAAYYERALALDPDHREAAWNLSLLQLLAGDFASGWQSYECRWGLSVPEHEFAAPQWMGEPLHGARILLHAEQGLGDTLQFLRYLPMVQAAGGRWCWRCRARCDGSLRSYPGLRVW